MLKIILLVEIFLIGIGGCTATKRVPTTKPVYEYHRYDFPGPDAPTIYKV